MKISFSKNLSEDGENWPQILAILSGSLSVVSCGFLFAWGSPFINKITADTETYNISEEEASHFTTLNLIIMVLSPLVSPIINVIGRKKSILLTSIPYIVSMLIKAFAKNLWLFYVSRLVYGLGDALLFTALPVYIGEVATPHVRGVWGNSFSYGIFLGYFMVNLIGTHFSIQDTSFIGLIFPVLFLATFSFVPETPYYYILKRNESKAEESLQILRHKLNVKKELEEIKAAVKSQIAEPSTWKDLFLVKNHRRALIAAICLRVGQVLSGFFVYSSYTAFIFDRAVGDINPHTSAIIYTALVVGSCIVASPFTEKLGRRLSFILSLSLAALMNLGEGTYFYLDLNTKVNLQYIRWFPLLGLVIFAVSSSLGIAMLPSLMSSELFSTNIKSKGVSLAISSYAAGIFVANNIFYYLNSHFGMYTPFFFFGVCNILSTILTYFVVPETKGKTLEEIQLLLKK